MKRILMASCVVWTFWAAGVEAAEGPAAVGAHPIGGKVREFAEFQVPARPAAVALTIDLPEDVAAPPGCPVTTGVPFADGWLKDASAVRVAGR